MNSDKQNVNGAADGATRQRQKTRWTRTVIIEVALLASGLICAMVFAVARLESYLSSQKSIEQFESATQAVNPAQRDEGQDSGEDEPDFSGWSEERLHAYSSAARQRRGTGLAVLQIPRLQLKAPVFDGTDELTLNHAVGRIEGTAWPGEPGNLGLAGHRDGFFRKLKDVRLGDEIELETRTGTDLYTAYKIEIVAPRDVSVLQSDGEPSLTLVTCYPFYFIGGAPKRFVVKAHLKHRNPAGMAMTGSRFNPQPLNPSLEEQ